MKAPTWQLSHFAKAWNEIGLRRGSVVVAGERKDTRGKIARRSYRTSRGKDSPKGDRIGQNATGGFRDNKQPLRFGTNSFGPTRQVLALAIDEILKLGFVHSGQSDRLLFQKVSLCGQTQSTDKKANKMSRTGSMNRQKAPEARGLPGRLI